MLSRRYRFHGYGSLRKVYNHSQNVRGSLIGLRFAQRPPGKPFRVAVVVARKVHKSAVKRNRIRRRVYEAVRRSQYLPKETDLILTVFNEQVGTMPTRDLDKQVNELLQKAATK